MRASDKNVKIKCPCMPSIRRLPTMGHSLGKLKPDIKPTVYPPCKLTISPAKHQTTRMKDLSTSRCIFTTDSVMISIRDWASEQIWKNWRKSAIASHVRIANAILAPIVWIFTFKLEWLLCQRAMTSFCGYFTTIALSFSAWPASERLSRVE